MFTSPEGASTPRQPQQDIPELSGVAELTAPYADCSDCYDKARIYAGELLGFMGVRPNVTMDSAGLLITQRAERWHTAHTPLAESA
jgi:hypothetical protein